MAAEGGNLAAVEYLYSTNKADFGIRAISEVSRVS